MHVLLVSNVARTLTRFRGSLIRELLARGHRVTAAAGDRDAAVERTLAGWGAEFEYVPLGRTGMNPFADIGTLAALAMLMRRVRPDVFFGYTVKPVVYGLIAARIAGVPRRVATVEGLGYAFSEGDEPRRKLARRIVTLAYRASLRFADALIVLNRDDETFFRDGGFLAERDGVVRIPGIGVDLDHYTRAPLPVGPVTFLMISRILRDKGVHEFVEAARVVKGRHSQARFVLLGPQDTNPAAIPVSEIEAWARDGIVDYRGAVDDVRPAIAACHVLVLPTRYREGMPRTILEAMAIGRPILATDVPGCRDAVVDGETGLLVPRGDVAALAAAMERFAGDRSLVAAAGEAGYARCRATFDTRIVVPRTVDILLGESSETG